MNVNRSTFDAKLNELMKAYEAKGLNEAITSGLDLIDSAESFIPADDYYPEAVDDMRYEFKKATNMDDLEVEVASLIDYLKYVDLITRITPAMEALRKKLGWDKKYGED